MPRLRGYRRSLCGALALESAAAAQLALPGLAEACATCVASAYGDRTFNWAYLGLLVMPFVITASVGGVLAWRAGVRPFHRLPAHDKETT